MTLRADVVVAGGGIAGLTAALTAQEAGVRVVVLEKAPQPGGSAAASGGTLWCAAGLESWLSVQPGGDPALGRAQLDGFFRGVEWLRHQGVDLVEVPDWKPYRMRRVVYAMADGAAAAMETLARRVVERGGAVLTASPLRDLLLDRDHGVRGVLADTERGPLVIDAPAAILATGGFQGSDALRARYLGQWADRMVLRANPYSTGDGLQAAVRAGAAVAGPFDRFYGHMVPAPPARVGLHNFAQVKPDFSEQAVFVNLRGERFDDEFLGDEVTVHAAVRQPEATVILIFDEAIRLAAAPPAGRAGADRLGSIAAAGGEIVAAPSLESLVSRLSDRWSVGGAALRRTLAAYNAAAARGDGAALDPPKSGGLVPIETPPFYALRLLVGITFTYGGARVDAGARVLNAAGRPIRGLYAAGADAGGVYTRGYAGGLSLGLAFGRLAGQGAATLALGAHTP